MRLAGATAIAVMGVAVALAGCSKGGPGTIDLSVITSSPAVAGAVTEWLAVLRTEADVAMLNDDTAAVKDIVDGSIVVSPAACFDGLPGSIDPSAYLLGVVAPTKEELDQLLAKLDRPMIFEGRVKTMCLD